MLNDSQDPFGKVLTGGDWSGEIAEFEMSMCVDKSRKQTTVAQIMNFGGVPVKILPFADTRNSITFDSNDPIANGLPLTGPDPP
jgi:hypothetical protein